MKLTRYTDYSLRVLMYVGLRPNQPTTMSEIAGAYGISRNHVMKVVYELGQMGYLKTTRGKHGGIELGRNADEINIGRFVRDTEKNLEIVECFGAKNECLITSACVLKSVLSQALNAFLGSLDKYTLADLIAPRSELQELLTSTR